MTNKARPFLQALVLLLSILSSISIIAQTSATTPAQPPGVTQEMRNQANDFYQHHDWANAAQAYEAITKLEPANAGAWSRRGASLHALGKYKEAVAAYERSLEINGQQPMTLFNLARSLARVNEKEKVFTSLGKAVEIGFSQTQMLESSEDLAPFSSDARFKQLLARTAINAKPCAARPEHRQLDFWIGDWDVTITKQNQVAGASSIQLILGDCIIFENWTGAGGTSGKSFNFFNSTTGRWQQTWVDDKGGLLEFVGDYKDGAMHYTATTTQSGQKVLQRMTLFNLSKDEMRQLGEQSADEGKTWSIIYDLTYTRRK